MPTNRAITGRLVVPALEAEDVIRHLARGVQHWKGGYSAHALATLWFAANDFPPKVRALLNETRAFLDLDLLNGFFERQTDLGDGGRPSQTDLLVLARNSEGVAVIGVEGKAEEPFGPTLFERIAESETIAARLEKLCAVLAIDRPDLALRYQLFHRAAACAIEAERYGARRALLLVHSFSVQQSSLADFKAFARALGMDGDVLPGAIAGSHCCVVNGATVDLYLGWVSDEVNHADFWDRLRQHADKSASYAASIQEWIAKRS